TRVRVADLLRGRTRSAHFVEAVLDPLRRAEPELLHAHFGWTAPIATRLQRQLRVPMVATFHATDVTVWPTESRYGRRNSYDAFFDVLSHAFVVSEYIGEVVRNLGYRGTMEVLPAGVQLARFPYSPGEAPRDGVLRLLYVGRLTLRKGLDVLLRALPTVVEAFPDTSLEVVGAGVEERQFQELAESLGVEHRVRFVGPQSADAIFEAMTRSHVLVLPSRVMPNGEVEGSPVIMKEAMAVGVPVVAARSGGSAEVLPPAYRDEAVPADDSMALGDRVVAVASSSQTWEERSRIGRQWVVEQYDWERLGARTAAVYSRLT
ncbi:MAG TPA: glycosyltransferase, partial [Solirubrobacteraceae bacterium]|nr:glycosyltransferase [Solirubrobacteraceae bacterium]